ASDSSATQKAVRIDSWETYRNTTDEDFPSIERFAGSYGIDVTYTSAVKDDNLYYQQVKDNLAAGNDIGADAVVLSQPMVARWMQLGYVQEFSHDRMPNVANIRDRFRTAPHDPNRRFSMPWRSGFTGLAWNKEAIPEGLSSVDQLWDASLKGKAGVMSSMQSTIGLLMMNDGVAIDSADWGEAEFSAAVDTLRQQVTSGQITAIKGNQYLDDLKTGATVAAFARSADILRLNEEAGDQWEFAIPSAGGVLWTQDIVIPIGSQRRTNVENFVNYYYDPTVAVEVAAKTHFVSPVEIRAEVQETLPAEIAGDITVFPTPVTLQSAKTFRHLSQAEEQKLMAQYQTVLLAAGG
ncbi:MAG TPA: spermidine/putrescine ABC transporter substrate-binding protein, partial [Terrimesophilobacter sp.]|nr:spermidine/putrescine ABC transporter substrate-binding protein [Terrimesophilobacter sp.]